jgi:RNA polymerase sigma-70 factor (ECF subfamily)
VLSESRSRFDHGFDSLVAPSEEFNAVATSEGLMTESLEVRMKHSAERASAHTLGDVYAEYFDFVWRSVRRLGVPEAAVDDAVQDVFLIVHARLAEFEGRSSIKTWLFAIVRRIVRDHRPSNRMLPTEHSLLESVPDERTSASPLNVAERNEATRLLHQLLDQLDAEKREVFILSDLEQMSAPEIAEALSVNLNTVYARLRAARAAMADALSRERARTSWRAPWATK